MRLFTVWMMVFVGLLGVSFPLSGQSTFHPQSIVNAADYSADTDGASVLIMQNGELIFEAYHNGANETTATHLHSGTKGFWALLAAHALEEGIFQSYDELAAATITEWQNNAVHPGKGFITIRHLLQLSSGLTHDIDQIQGSDPAAPDVYQYVVDSLDLNAFPGNQFRYGPSHYYAFGVLLQRKLQAVGIDMNPLEYLDSIILNPIGFEYTDWFHDQSGNPHIPNGCTTTPRNWMKYGQLVLQKGRWGTTQIVDSMLVEDLLVADGPNPGHGQFLWLNNPEGYGAVPSQAAPPGSAGGFMYHEGFPEIIGMLGAGKNRMYLIPSMNAIVVRQTLAESDNYEDNEFLTLLLANLTTAVSEPGQRSKTLEVYPNPAEDKISLSGWVQGEVFQGQIFSMEGRRMLQFENQTVVDISQLPPGMYVLVVQTPLGEVTQRILKE